MANSDQTIATPWEFFNYVEKANNIKFVHDLAASEKNAKCKSYFTVSDNALEQEWHKIDGWLWLNPPFAEIKKWATKCYIESRYGAKICMITPLETDGSYMPIWEHASKIDLLHGRVWPEVRSCMLSFWGTFPDMYRGRIDVIKWKEFFQTELDLQNNNLLTT